MYNIQVCNDYSSEIARKREIESYIALNEQIQKIVVINKPIGEYRDGLRFTIIGARDFMLHFIK